MEPLSTHISVEKSEDIVCEKKLSKYAFKTYRDFNPLHVILDAQIGFIQSLAYSRITTTDRIEILHDFNEIIIDKIHKGRLKITFQIN